MDEGHPEGAFTPGAAKTSKETQSVADSLPVCGAMQWGCRSIYSGGGGHAGAMAVKGAGLGVLTASRLFPSWGGEWLGQFASSEQGSMVTSWALGVVLRETIYGADNVMTQVIQDEPSTEALRRKVKQLLIAGGAAAAEGTAGGYSPGDPSPFNGNVWRDLSTDLFYPLAPEGSRTLLVLDTYDLVVSEYD